MRRGASCTGLSPTNSAQPDNRLGLGGLKRVRGQAQANSTTEESVGKEILEEEDLVANVRR